MQENLRMIHSQISMLIQSPALFKHFSSKLIFSSKIIATLLLSCSTPTLIPFIAFPPTQSNLSFALRYCYGCFIFVSSESNSPQPYFRKLSHIFLVSKCAFSSLSKILEFNFELIVILQLAKLVASNF